MAGFTLEFSEFVLHDSRVSKEAESQLQTDYLHQLTGVWSDRRLSVQKEFHILLQTLRNTPQKGSPELPQL